MAAEEQRGGPPSGPDTHEPSYYEIALTNRQVYVAFVILLGCVVAAFFTGVWIGREGRILPDTNPQVAATEPKPGEPKMEEFEFFSDSPAVKQPAVAKPEPGKTLLEDLGGGERAETSAPGALAEIEPGADTPDAPTPEAAPSDVASPPPAATPPPTVASAPPPPPPPAGEGVVYVQVFSSADEAQARRIMMRLERAGFKAVLSPVKVGATEMYRVRVGPFSDAQAARPAAEQIKRRLELDTWITR